MFHITRTRTHTHTRTLALLSRLPRRGADWLHVIVLEDDTGICQLVEVFSHDATRAVHEIQLVITKVICKSHQNTKNVRRRKKRKIKKTKTCGWSVGVEAVVVAIHVQQHRVHRYAPAKMNMMFGFAAAVAACAQASVSSRDIASVEQ